MSDVCIYLLLVPKTIGHQKNQNSHYNKIAYPYLE